MRRRSLHTTALLALGVASPARAQDATLFRASPSGPDGWGTVGVLHPGVGDAGAWYAGVGTEYARNPLVVRSLDGTPIPLVAHRVGTTLLAGYTVTDSLRLDAGVPAFPWAEVEGARTAALGDVTLGASWSVDGHDDVPIDIGLAPRLTLPGGGDRAYVSAGGIGGGLSLCFGDRGEHLSWAVESALVFRPDSRIGEGTADETVAGTRVEAGAGGSVAVRPRVRLGAEAEGAVGLVGPRPGARPPLQALGFASWAACSGPRVSAGFGGGILPGIGSPDWMAVLGLGWRGAECVDPEWTPPVQRKAKPPPPAGPFPTLPPVPEPPPPAETEGETGEAS